MTAPAPWSVKGIDPKAREVAKELARREGLTLGEWLNRTIVGQDGGAPSQPSAEPIPLEPSVRGLLGRLERGEREQVAVAARFEALAEELRHDQMRLAERLRQVEQGSLQDAVRDLALGFIKLDGRLRRIEGSGGDADRLAALEDVRAELAALSENVDRRLAKADGAQAAALDKLGHEVSRVSERLVERIVGVERRGALAVEDVAEQVGRVAERIHQRQERAAEDVANRFRQADEQTARLLEEMRAQIDASFAAARRAPAPLVEAPTFAGPSVSTREVIEQARAKAAAEPAPTTAKADGFSLFAPRKKPRKGGGSTTLQTALFVTGAAAALGAGVASYRLGVAEPPTSPVAVPGEPPPARATVALSEAAREEAAAPAPNAAVIYAEAVKRLEAHDPAGLAELRQAANLGHPAAQFHLARLYESGSGLKKDETEARRWTEQAARGGDAKAMHNLALYYFQGVGGAKDPKAAALWFGRAAEKGVTDSQYNLGRLYEEGYGVPRDTATAYRWYLIAGRAGDADARASAHRVRGLLTPDARAAAEAAANP